MTFKESLVPDLDTFLSTDEFAEEHKLNGTLCRCVVQSPTARERFLQSKANEGMEGIHGKTVIVHVRKDSLPDLPAEGQRLDLDGEILLVESCVDDMGMLSIELHGEAFG